MLRKLTIAAAAMMIFGVGSVFADQDCATGKFVGTYTRVTAAEDLVGNGELHAYVFQLTFHADGTVTQYWTGFPDYMISAGTGSPWIGSWKCRDNGNVLVNVIGATYVPSAADSNFGLLDDVKLYRHTRSTYVFNIDDNNTMTRIKARARTYEAAEDPTDPNGGTLGILSTTPLVYKRLSASAADLTAP